MYYKKVHFKSILRRFSKQHFTICRKPLGELYPFTVILRHPSSRCRLQKSFLWKRRMSRTIWIRKNIKSQTHHIGFPEMTCLILIYSVSREIAGNWAYFIASSTATAHATVAGFAKQTLWPMGLLPISYHAVRTVPDTAGKSRFFPVGTGKNEDSKASRFSAKSCVFPQLSVRFRRGSVTSVWHTSSFHIPVWGGSTSGHRCPNLHDTSCMEQMKAIYPNIRNPYAQSKACLLFGMRKQTDTLPLLLREYERMKKSYPHDSFAEGPLLGIYLLFDKA